MDSEEAFPKATARSHCTTENLRKQPVSEASLEVHEPQSEVC